jgi:hypothetical protein
MPSLSSDETAPRSALNLEEMRDRVRGDLGLRDSSLLTDDDLMYWFNEGSDRIARFTRWYRIADLMGTEAGIKEYALPLPAMGRCIAIEEVWHDDLQLDLITLPQLSRVDRNYLEDATGTPFWYYLRGSNGFGLHYTPSTTDADALTVIYVAKPPRVTDDTDHFYVPHSGEDALIVYAKKLASEKDMYGEGAKRAALYAAEWERLLAEIKRQVDSAGDRGICVVGEEGAYEGIGPYPRIGWQTIPTPIP